VAYGSLLVERRRPLHERTARAIEELYRDGLDGHYGELAHHYERTENTPKAVKYLALAGEQAAQRSAYAEAIRQLSRGVELVATLPESRERARQELPLQVTLGQALTVTGGYGTPEAERAFVRARSLSEEVGEASRVFPASVGLYEIHLVRAQHHEATAIVEELLRLAQRTQDPVQLMWAHVLMAEVSVWQGEFSRALEQSEGSIRRYDPQQYRDYERMYGEADPAVWALVNLGLALWALGYPEQAIAKNREAITLAQELSHPFSEASALLYASGAHWLRRESQAALEMAEGAIALSSERGFLQYVGMATFYRSAALADQGHLQEGIAGMGAVVEALRASGVELSSPWFLTELAKAHRMAGQAEQGLSLVSEAQELVSKNGERYAEAEMHRVKGELILTRSPSDHTEAEVSFRESLDVARRQTAKSYELRTVTSLARLLQQRDRGQEARDLLAPIYAWFTEGFDTKDLKDAKALLDELA
jgi:predicted ATPase